MTNIRIGHKIIRKKKYEEHIYLNLDKFSGNPGLLQLFYVCEGILDGSGKYSFPHGKTQCIHLEFCEGGALSVTCKKKRKQIGNDCVYIEKPGNSRHYYTFSNPGKEKCRRYALAMIVNNNFEPIFHLQERDIIRNADMEKLTAGIRTLLERMKTKKGCSPEEISVNLFEILTFLTATLPTNKNTSADTEKEKLAIVQTFPQRFPDLKSLQEFFEVSRETLYRIFRQHTGKSPMDFVIQARLLNSCWMLKETQYPVGEIARIIGYDSPAFYSNSFKKLFGLSPTECRKTGFSSEKAKANLEAVRKHIYRT